MNYEELKGFKDAVDKVDADIEAMKVAARRKTLRALADEFLVSDLKSGKKSSSAWRLNCPSGTTREDLEELARQLNADRFNCRIFAAPNGGDARIDFDWTPVPAAAAAAEAAPAAAAAPAELAPAPAPAPATDAKGASVAATVPATSPRRLVAALKTFCGDWGGRIDASGHWVQYGRGARPQTAARMEQDLREILRTHCGIVLDDAPPVPAAPQPTSDPRSSRAL